MAYIYPDVLLFPTDGPQFFISISVAAANLSVSLRSLA